MENPRLADHLQIIPCATGWMVRVKSEVMLWPSAHGPLRGDALLDLIDGMHDLNTISDLSGIDQADLKEFLELLTKHDLLCEGAKEANPKIDHTLHPARGQHKTGSLQGLSPVLLVGLGEFGLAVLQDLRLHGAHVYLFDPVPVQMANVQSFYQLAEVGADKTQIIWNRLGTYERERIHSVKADALTEDGVTAALHNVIPRAGVVICCTEQASYLPEVVARICRPLGVPMIPASVTQSGGTVGPICWSKESPSSEGCFICASLYRAERDPFSAALYTYVKNRFPLCARWRYSHPGLLRSILSRFVLLAMSHVLEGKFSVHHRTNRLLAVRSENWAGHVESIPKHYACELCFPPRDLKALQLRNETRRLWERNYGAALDPQDLVTLYHRLKALVGEDYGIFRFIRDVSQAERQSIYRFFYNRGVDPKDSLIANAHSAVAVKELIRQGRSFSISTTGLDFYDDRAAMALSLMEGVERLFTLEYCDPKRIIQKRFRAVRRSALDPRLFPLYAKKQYEDPTLRVRKFEPDKEIQWLWGTRIPDGEPVLVPLDLVYGFDPMPLYRANSNGASAHSSFHYAILNGIYETIERDALMAVWLNEMSLPIVDLGATEIDPFSVRKQLHQLSFELTHVNISTDLEIPVLLGIIQDRLNPDLFLLNMVSSLDAERLLRKLYKELVQFSYPYLIDQNWYQGPLSSSHSPELVVTFRDHLSFYQNREKIKKTSFLTASQERKPFAVGPFSVQPLTVKQELERVVERLAKRGYETIVVDCSTPFLRSLGLYALKVLIPGLQPLHAGHQYAPLGGRRVFEIAKRMRLADKEKSLEELNAWPHPFW